jgi:hypothetical protein
MNQETMDPTTRRALAVACSQGYNLAFIEGLEPDEVDDLAELVDDGGTIAADVGQRFGEFLAGVYDRRKATCEETDPAGGPERVQPGPAEGTAPAADQVEGSGAN